MENKGIFDVESPDGIELLEDGLIAQDSICEQLKEVKAFEGFGRLDLVYLVKHMKTYRVRQGTTIFREWDNNSYLSVLLEGRVGVYKEDSDDNIKFITALSPGRVFGEISVIDNLPFSASIIAETDATIATMSRESFHQCVDARPDIGVRLLDFIARLLSARLRSVSRQLVDYIDV